MNHILWPILLMIAISVPSKVIADPSIRTATAKSLTDEYAFVMRGNGFGTKSVPAPLVWDDFSSGDIGDTISGVWSYYSLNGSSYLPQYSIGDSRTANDQYASVYLRGSHVDIMSVESLDFSSRKIYLDFWAKLQHNVG